MMNAAPPPNGLPPVTAGQIFFRLVAVAALCAVMIGASIFAGKQRDRYIHEPVCTRVCGQLGMRYEGVTQHRKSDAAAACQCVGNDLTRRSVPTRFFSDNAVLDFFARELTSTMGVLLFIILGAVGGIGLVAALKRRSSPPS